MTGKIISIILSICMLVTFAGCGKDNTENQPEKVSDYTAVITVKNYGDIELILYGEKAPITVSNFVSLAESGFYDGLTFHRIIKDFMIQGGDPKGDGTGGSGKNIKGEFKSNGIENDISHERGVISMARSKDPDSASSQFFIIQNTKNSLHLNGDYAAFGKVTSGMEIVDKIAEETQTFGYNGEVERGNQPVMEKITVKEK